MCRRQQVQSEDQQLFCWMDYGGGGALNPLSIIIVLMKDYYKMTKTQKTQTASAAPPSDGANTDEERDVASRI